MLSNAADIDVHLPRIGMDMISAIVAQVLNLRDFLADNIGQSFVGIVAKALDDNYRRYNH